MPLSTSGVPTVIHRGDCVDWVTLYKSLLKSFAKLYGYKFPPMSYFANYAITVYSPDSNSDTPLGQCILDSWDIKVWLTPDHAYEDVIFHELCHAVQFYSNPDLNTTIEQAERAELEVYTYCFKMKYTDSIA